MKHALALTFVAAAALVGSAHALDVYKWKDDKGVVHYGDQPASGAAATTVNVPDGEPSPADEAAAKQRLEQARQKLADDVDGEPSATTQARSARKPAATPCAQAWQRYDAAQACFDNHRVAGGKGVSDAGIAACKQIAQPTCAR